MITSKDNARVKRWAKLMRDSSLRRREKRVVIEGSHLVTEALRAGLKPLALLVSESGLEGEGIRSLIGQREPVILSDAVFRSIADVEHPQGIAAEIALPEIEASGHCVFLEGVQDPSNVGAIIRSAAAFGVAEVVLDRGCADAWSAKTLRAGMGGHFKLALRQEAEFGKELDAFQGTLVCTAAREGGVLGTTELTGRLGWIFGSEGKGISETTRRRAGLTVRIPMTRETESLNVAAAAAICLYEAFSRRGSAALFQ